MRAGRAILYAAALGGLGLGVRSVIKGQMPLPVSAFAIATFGTIVMAGVVEPRLSMFADVLNHGDPSPSEPRVALTFDDGPSEASTPRILDLLDEAGMHATFFVVGRKLAGAGAAIVRRAVERGHEI